MIWLFCVAIALVAVLLITVKSGAADRDADPLSHYKEQLEEITADVERGILDEESAASAKLEIERRILKTVRKAESKTLFSGSVSTVLPIAGAVVIGAWLVYSQLGSPNAQSKPGVFVTMQNAEVTEGGPTFREALDKIQLHLDANPDDIEGWSVMAKTARSVGDYSRTINAYKNIVRLQPEDSRYQVDMLESYIAMAQGKITPAAKMVLQDLLRAEPNHPAAHYYLGLTRLQAGDEEGAKTVWLALAESSAADAPWMPTVNKHLQDMGVRPPKLSQDQIDNVNAMTAEDRQEFIRSMMARLEAKLEENPTDSQGWMMLARSQVSQGDKKSAISTLNRALEAVNDADKPKIQAFLDNLLNSNDF
ncbi:c-type cytochrome biogenesis protein CcmI [Kordiimonas laminariae]|uniref:c-type cytochrome biogenesis protein CcmI n=1 Tax=Kordiimonas laminariae TaxID=2917717 RepID=UPI001FF4CEA9|nr:c-type cytochrome biogenesis protein CcmI [Kordiimonas laminariae]MCK0069992.1 c-type cytochrome biogenesis protein CcmI [Kordiimonas laminariae]